VGGRRPTMRGAIITLGTDVRTAGSAKVARLRGEAAP
jgi:hypothetical protein